MRVLYNNAMEELIQKDLKGNGVLFARSVTTGANGIGFLWGGDNEASFSPENGLPTVVTAGLECGDERDVAVGGGPGRVPEDGRLRLIRCWRCGGRSLRRSRRRWRFFRSRIRSRGTGMQEHGGTQALDVYRKYAVLHMSLFPYRYAAAQESAKTGMPIMRALALVYQDDARARVARDEYMFGPDLLVAPVVDENTRRPVYLPAGEWVDYWTGAR